MDNYYLQFRNPFFIGIIMSLLVGPVFFILIKTSILKGIKAAISFDIGAIFSDIVFILIAYFGSRSLLEKVKNDPKLAIGGGLILLIYGLVTYFDPKNKKDVDRINVEIIKEKKYFRLFIGGFLLNFINIGVLAGWLGIMVIIADLNLNEIGIFWFFVQVILGFLAVDFVKIFLAKQLQKKMTPLVIYRMQKITGIILIIFGIAMMSKSLITV